MSRRAPVRGGVPEAEPAPVEAVAAPPELPAQLLLRLQRGAGNAHVSALVRSGALERPRPGGMLLRGNRDKEEVSSSDEEMAAESEEAPTRKRERDEEEPLGMRGAKQKSRYGRVAHSARLREKQGAKGPSEKVVRPQFGPVKSGRAPGERHRESLFKGNRPSWEEWDEQIDNRAYACENAEGGTRLWTQIAGDGEVSRAEYMCFECEEFFPRKTDKWTGDTSYITLDHRTPWAQLKASMPERTWTDEKGHEWRGYLQSDAEAEFNDLSNLVPMCQSCNSERNKGGNTRVFDSNFDPSHDPSTCPQCTGVPATKKTKRTAPEDDDRDEPSMSEDES